MDRLLILPVFADVMAVAAEPDAPSVRFPAGVVVTALPGPGEILTPPLLGEIHHACPRRDRHT